MDDKTTNSFEFIKFGEREMLIGNAWQTERKLKGALLKLQLRHKASESNAHYSFFSEVQSLGKTSSQYSLVELDESNSKGVVSGDLVVAKNAKSWVPDEYRSKNKSTVFIYSIGSDSLLSEPEFWIVAVTDSGLIHEEVKCKADDRYALADTLRLFGFVNSFNVVHLVTDGAVKSFLKENKDEYSFVSFDDEKEKNNDILGDDDDDDSLTRIFTITEDKFSESISKTSGIEAKRIYKPSKIKVKKLGIGIGTAAALIGLWFSYSFISQKEAIDYFETSNLESELIEKSKTHSSLAKDLKNSSSKWDNETFRSETLNQFVESLGGNVYSPMDVALVLRELNRTMPMFAAEWRLVDFTFENNRFFCRYKRIKGGKGVFFLLDDVITSVNEEAKLLSIKPFDLKNQGEVRTYQITPVIDLPKKDLLISMQDKLQEEVRLKKNLAKANKQVNDSIRDALSSFSNYRELSFQDKWFKRASIELLNEHETFKANLQRADRLFNKTIKFNEGESPLLMDQNLILGNVMDFVTMMQMDSFFDWSFPIMTNGFPDNKTLSSKNPKKSKKKKSSGETYFQAIESYNVEITSQETEGEGKTISYGISDIIQLGILINKPFVNVDSVEYSKITEQWEFNIHFHRQTSKYRNRIANIK